MTEKELFIEKLKARTKKFAVEIISFCDSLEGKKASTVITYQIIKSATSTGANYRAACRARSKKEFFSKISIVVEEVDETQYWLEIIEETGLSPKKAELERLLKESIELNKIMSKARNTSYATKA
jgi:four helix bundle protein